MRLSPSVQPEALHGALSAKSPVVSGVRVFAWALSLVLAIAASGCATVSTATPPGASAGPNVGTAPGSNPKDPFERFNRAIFAFNNTVDKALLKPVAQAYVAVLPEPVRRGIGNVFGTVEDLWSGINHVLQGKPAEGMQMGMRAASNLFFGMGGLLDPATELGLERQSEDLGQTLGAWGVGPGPYVVLPLFGPRTLRDAAALPVDRWASLSRQAETREVNRSRLSILGVVDTRASLLGASRILSDVALDPYGFTRDAYLQRRRNQVYDGDPPEEPPEAPDPSSDAGGQKK